ncbi:hypothetical protein [Gemmatimonas sp. UBA7669]|uniref:hypothetical protein n=1 Tax=Gemmatimonas sp. UBA7669 TaxID=1946568 RepID=UPI0025C29085|nr:hypothetical protein [Gemmatimonas sp. UBA7669]
MTRRLVTEAAAWRAVARRVNADPKNPPRNQLWMLPLPGALREAMHARYTDFVGRDGAWEATWPECEMLACLWLALEAEEAS